MKTQGLNSLDLSSWFGFVTSLRDVYGDRIALSTTREGDFETRTYSQLVEGAHRLARFLLAAGLSPGDRVALLSESRLEVPEVIFGTLLSGCVLVPIDIKLSPREIAGILRHSETRLVIVSRDQEELLAQAARVGSTTFPILTLGAPDRIQDISRLPDFRHARLGPRDPEEIALVIYTSGTFGSPKGVMTKARAILFQVESTGRLSATGEREVFLSMLPMNHLFELVSGLLVSLAHGAEICIAQSLERDHLMYCLNQRRVTQMMTVPLFLANLKKGLEGRIRQAGRFKIAVFSLLVTIAAWLPMSMRRRLFGQIHRGLGGHLKRFVTGGAPAGRELIRFFAALGLPIYEGYGLSETGPVVAVNRQDAWRPGSVGLALPGVEVRISGESGREGEIHTRGPHVMAGYLKAESLTREVLSEDGWFRTGDVGYIDKDGFLHITGRIKKMIVLDGGKKVHSEEVEFVLNDTPYIKECCVLGSSAIDSLRSGSEQVVAVIVPSEFALEEAQGDWSSVERRLRLEVETLSRDLAVYKRPTRIVITKEELPKTTTLKVKTPEVARLIAPLLKESRDSMRV